MKKLTMTMLLCVIANGVVCAAPAKTTKKAAPAQRAESADKRLMQAISETDVKTFEQELDRSAKVAKTNQGVKALIGQAYLIMLDNKANKKLDRGEKSASTRRLNKIVNLLREKRASVLEKA